MSPILSPPDFLHPQLSVQSQAFIRIGFGMLMAGTLLLALPHWRRFFLSDRWGGYAESSRGVELIHNPVVAPFVLLVWLAADVMLIAGYWTIAASAINLIFCYYFFVSMRWKGVLRGMGAPGFMSYWLAAAVFLLELTSHYALASRSLALLVLQVDFAFIMLSAGIYKFTAGYPRNHGMEGGMVNPQWGYWWWLYQKLRPTHRLFRLLNHMAWSLEVLAGFLMLIPRTRFIGGLIILASFVFIATQIRLAMLCEMVGLCCVLFFHSGSYGDQLLTAALPFSVTAIGVAQNVPVIQTALTIVLTAYLVILPFAHVGLFYNFYGRKSLPGFLQRVLELYTNFFGIIIWRVFSADHTNFFIRIHLLPVDGVGKRQLISRVGIHAGLRYNHVAESIVLTTVFTTLKYYPSQSELFLARLLRYARTINCAADSILEFEYVNIVKTENGFDFVPVAVYVVDITARTVSEGRLDEEFSVRSAHEFSPLHAGLRPGSYVSS